MPAVNVWWMRRIVSGQREKWVCMNRYVKRGESEKFPPRKKRSTGNNRILCVRYETVTLMRVEVGIEPIFTKKIDREKTNTRCRNEKSLMKGQEARGCLKFDHTHTNSGDGMITQTHDRVGFDGSDGLEV